MKPCNIILLVYCEALPREGKKVLAENTEEEFILEFWKLFFPW
jgi:hypothetical protein